jgi:hypothetical protein
LHQIKNFCTSKEIIVRIKRPPTEWEKKIVSYSMDKGLTSRIYEERAQKIKQQKHK